MANSWEILKLLADPTRLRLINLLRQDELSVAELQDVLDMGQSRISSHLSLLRQGGLARDRKEGKRTYYTVRTDLPAPVFRAVDAACEAVTDEPDVRRDSLALKRVVEMRRKASERYFNEIAGNLGKNYCPGRSWEAIGHFLLRLVPRIEVADLGSGEGLLSHLLARSVKQVTCVDSSPQMVRIGRELADRLNIANVRFIEGDIEDVPLPDGSVDLAILSQALHHAARPQQAVNEALRILRPGGRITVIDLLEHQFEKARELYADRWLGFSENSLYEFLDEAGFHHVEVAVVAREEQEPGFQTILGSGIK